MEDDKVNMEIPVYSDIALKGKIIGAVEIQGTEKSSGKISAIIANGDIDVDGNVNIDGNVDIDGDVTITGRINLPSDTSANYPLSLNLTKNTNGQVSMQWQPAVIFPTAKALSEITTDQWHYVLTYDLAKQTTHYNSNVYLTSAGLRVDGVIDANTFNASSDKRLKTNIKPYTAMKSILDLPIYEFDYKNNDIHTIGCLAQDLQEICPEIVTYDSNGFLQIAESKLVYLLLQELKTIKEAIKDGHNT